VALREVIALLDVQVKGVERIKKANVGLDAFVAKMRVAALANLQGAGALGGAGLLGTLGPVGLGIGAVTIAVGVVTKAIGAMADRAEGLVHEMISLGSSLQDTSQRLGISTGELQRWQFIAGQAGVSTGLLESVLGRMQRQAFATPRVFEQIGVRVRGANGEIKDASTLLEQTGRALAGIRNPAERAAQAQQIFGRQGRMLLPLFADGERGIQRLTARFRELGGGMSEDVVQSADDAGDALAEFDLSITSLKAVFVREVLPVIAEFVSKVATVVGKFVEWARASNMSRVALYAIVGVIALAASPVIALGAALAAIVVIVEDIVTAFSGGESVFSLWTERLMGAFGIHQTFAGLLESIGVGWDSLRARILAAVATMREAIASLGPWIAGGGAAAAAAGARAAADQANAELAAGQKALREHERQRVTERFAAAGERIRASAAPVTADPIAAKLAEQARITNNAPVIHVHGVQDPEAAGRAAARHVQSVLRGAADALPLAPEPAT
jgi:hypothetical protein